MTPRQRLRSGTAENHERVDALFGRFDLGNVGGYGRFLSAQAEAFLPVEAAIDTHGMDMLADWPSRRRGALLRQDLAELGIAVPVTAGAPRLDDDAAALGALYVLEGSRLGGTMLSRSLAPGMPQSFLGRKGAPGSWPKLLELLDEFLYGSVRIGLALDAARAVFELFEAAGRRQLEADSA